MYMLIQLFAVPLLSSTAISLATLSDSLLANCDKAGACKMMVECLHLLQKEVVSNIQIHLNVFETNGFVRIRVRRGSRRNGGAATSTGTVM
jgi:hypothetical protein